MATAPEFPTLSFTDETLLSILSKPSTLGEDTVGTSQETYEDWESLSELKKNMIKTQIHGIMMTEYLRAKISPLGLIVANDPKIFLDDPEFRKAWAHISWKCTIDWLILIVKTAERLAAQLLIKIEATERHLKTTVSNTAFKSKLAEINKEIKDNETYLLQQKANKLHKDIKNFKFEKIFPYSTDEFTPPKTQTSSRKRSNNQYWTSSSDDQWSSGDDEPIYHQPPRGNRYQHPRLPGPFNQGIHPMMNVPFNQPMWQYSPFLAPRPYFQDFQPQPFLGRGRGKGRGRRRGNRGTQVQWQDNASTIQTRSRGPV